MEEPGPPLVLAAALLHGGGREAGELRGGQGGAPAGQRPHTGLQAGSLWQAGAAGVAPGVAGRGGGAGPAPPPGGRLGQLPSQLRRVLGRRRGPHQRGGGVHTAGLSQGLHRGLGRGLGALSRVQGGTEPELSRQLGRGGAGVGGRGGLRAVLHGGGRRLVQGGYWRHLAYKLQEF